MSMQNRIASCDPRVFLRTHLYSYQRIFLFYVSQNTKLPTLICTLNHKLSSDYIH